MKQRIANNSIVLLVLVVIFGLFQAWKQNRRPFVNYSNVKEKEVSYESFKLNDIYEQSNVMFTSKLMKKR